MGYNYWSSLQQNNSTIHVKSKPTLSSSGTTTDGMKNNNDLIAKQISNDKVCQKSGLMILTIEFQITFIQTYLFKPILYGLYMFFYTSFQIKFYQPSRSEIANLVRERGANESREKI